MSKNFYNAKSRELQDQNDTRRLADQLERTRLHHQLTEEDVSVISKASFFFLATSDGNNLPDCSIKGGNPGFVKVLDESAILFSDYDGNGMYRSIGNIMENGNVGLLFLSTCGPLRKLRINGNAHISKGNKLSNIDVKIEIRQIFPNCPRYLPEIRIGSQSKYNPSPGYTPPSPIWKSKPDLIDYLPEVGRKKNDI